MLEIFLNILLFLLCAIGIVIALVLIIGTTILLSPLKYNFAGGNKEGEIFAKGSFSWLSKIIIGDFSYSEDNNTILKLKIFGKDVEDFIKKRKNKKDIKNKKKQDKQNRKRRKQEKLDPVLLAREKESIEEPEEINEPENLNETKEIKDICDGFQLIKDIESMETLEEDKEIENAKEIEENQEVEELFQIDEETGFKRVKLSEIENVDDEEIDDEENKSENDEDIKISHKIKSKINSIVKNIQKNKDKFKRNKKKLVRNYKQTKIYYSKFENIQNKKLILEKTRKLIKTTGKEVLPKELNISGVIGFDDPCTTGHFMGFVSLLVAKYGEHIDLEGDFTKSNYENIHIDGNGRIVFGKLIFVVGSYWFDPIFQEEFKKFLGNGK